MRGLEYAPLVAALGYMLGAAIRRVEIWWGRVCVEPLAEVCACRDAFDIWAEPSSRARYFSLNPRWCPVHKTWVDSKGDPVEVVQRADGDVALVNQSEAGSGGGRVIKVVDGVEMRTSW